MSRTDEPATAVDDQISAIEAEFPRWQAWMSDTGDGWAAVRSTLTPGQVAAGCVSFLRAADANELVQRIREQEQLLEAG